MLVHFLSFVLLLSLTRDVNSLSSQNMAVLGDSLSIGFDCQGTAIQANVADNWATGTNTAVVNSVWNHLNIYGGTQAANYATAGDKMIDILNHHVPEIGSDVDLVLIEGGANDACGGANTTINSMTPLADFHQQVTQVLNEILVKAKPGVKIIVFSIPNVYNLWSLFHANPFASFIWNYGSICQPLLANPTSTAEADVLRRASFGAQVVAYNNILKEVCTSIPNQQCVFDNNLVYNWNFQSDDVSTLDYFHPSCTSPSHGQGYAASLIWDWLSTTVGETPATAAPVLGVGSFVAQSILSNNFHLRRAK